MPVNNSYTKVFQPMLAGLATDTAKAEMAGPDGYNKAIFTVRERIIELQALATKRVRGRETEIYYFREVWPVFFAKLFYYTKVYGFEMERRALSADAGAGLFRREEMEAARYFRGNREFWLYYKAGSPVIDGQFTREYSRGCVYDYLSLVADSSGATLASYRAAWGLAYESYMIFLKREWERLDDPAGLDELDDYSWDSSDTDFVEWMYGLQAVGAIRYKGELADISRLQKWAKLALRKEVVNIYDRFKVIRNRKKEKMAFTKRTGNALERRMDEAEGKFE